MFSIAFFAMKRIGEYNWNRDTKSGILLKQWTMELKESIWQESTWCSLDRTKGKTHQYGADLYAILVCTCWKEVCALCALKRLINERKGNREWQAIANEETFKFTNGKILNKYKMGRKVKELGKAIGFTKNFSGHSFRKGGAQHAVTEGLEAAPLQKQADWASYDMVAHYFGNISREEMARLMKRTFGKK